MDWRVSFRANGFGFVTRPRSSKRWLIDSMTDSQVDFGTSENSISSTNKLPNVARFPMAVVRKQSGIDCTEFRNWPAIAVDW